MRVRQTVWKTWEPYGVAPEALVLELQVTKRTVSLHLHPDGGRVTPENTLIELPIDPALGRRDPNFRILRVVLDAAEAEIDRQEREAATAPVPPPDAVDHDGLAFGQELELKRA